MGLVRQEHYKEGKIKNDSYTSLGQQFLSLFISSFV